MDANTVKVAFPKKGRLGDAFAQIWTEAGFSLVKADPRHSYGTAFSEAGSFTPFEATAQRDSDALEDLADNIADLAIVGLNALKEFNAAASARGRDTVFAAPKPLNFSRCAMVLAGPGNSPLSDLRGLYGQRIATSFPETLKDWLRSRDIDTDRVEIVERDGGIEDYVRRGRADYAFDIYQSGKTQEAYGLKPFYMAFESTAVAVVRNDAPRNVLELQDTLSQELSAASARCINNGAISEPYRPPRLAAQDFTEQPRLMAA